MEAISQIKISNNPPYPAYSPKSVGITIAHALMSPLWHAEKSIDRCFLPIIPGKYGFAETRVKEIFLRVVYALYAFPAAFIFLPLHLIGNVILACLVGKNDIEVLKGSPIIEDRLNSHLAKDDIATAEPTNFSLLQWNLCAMRGSLPWRFGGMAPASDRTALILDYIKSKQPDVISLSEVDPLIGDAIAQDLANSGYERVYYRYGLSVLGMGSCLLVAVKKASYIDNEAAIEYTPLPLPEKGAQTFFQRGFLSVPVMGRTLLLTHLHPGDEKEDKAQRKLQMETIETYTENHPASHILAGDLNMKDVEGSLKNWTPLGGKPCQITATDEYENGLKGISRPPKLEILDHILSKNLHQKSPSKGPQPAPILNPWKEMPPYLTMLLS